jgi:Ca2+/Na+ antiporter
MAEGEATFDVDREVQSDNCFPLLGILFLRTYALYHGNKKFLVFLISLYLVCLPLLLRWIFKADRVILGHARYRYRHCSPFRALSAMYVIYLSGLHSNISSSP